MTQRHYSMLDQICLGIDQALKAISGKTLPERAYPADQVAESELTEQQRKHAAALMRINHSGEVCAQALYQGQGIASRCAEVRDKMHHAMKEEGDHLAWCSRRITELGSHTSYLNPFWYSGSFILGLTAGIIGDKWSLGFLAETEHQVVRHLKNQMDLLPVADQKSFAILRQMQNDEAQHRDDALEAGAAELPEFIKKLMSWTSKIMVKSAYWV